MQGGTTFYYFKCYYLCGGNAAQLQDRAGSSLTMVRTGTRPSAQGGGGVQAGEHCQHSLFHIPSLMMVGPIYAMHLKSGQRMR